MLLSQHSNLAQWEKEAAVKEKSMRMAHDIRNPLAVIQAVCASLLLETEDPEQRERLRLISGQVDQLASALTGAVDGEIGPDDGATTLYLQHLCVSLVNLLRYRAGENVEFRIQVEPDLCCRLPERELTRSLYHLLSNAVDAVNRRGGGRVQITCRADGARLAIEVADNGPGLPPELVDKGPRRYAAERPGTALGLCSVERFVRNLDGRLTLGCSEAGGALIGLDLPIDCEEAAAQPPRPTAGAET